MRQTRPAGPYSPRSAGVSFDPGIRHPPAFPVTVRVWIPAFIAGLMVDLRTLEMDRSALPARQKRPVPTALIDFGMS